MTDQRRATVGLAIIAKNEEASLPELLASIEGAFDRVVLLDTGSVDDTILVFQEWAKNQPVTWSVARFEWCEDFAAARAAADRLLMFGAADERVARDRPMVDWTCWADCDDVIDGALELRKIAGEMPGHVAAVICGYDYAQHPVTGATICHLRRERLVRAGRGTWMGRVHEAQVVEGPSAWVPDDRVVWRHRKQAQQQDAGAASNERNLRILHAWLDDEPENSRVLAYLGTEHAARGDVEQAIGFYERYRELVTTWDEERAQVYRKMASCYLMLERVEDAEQIALQAIALVPTWPDSYLTLAEVALHRGQFDKAIHFAEQAAAIGQPQTLLIVNPLDYTGHPHRLLAGAYGSKGEWDRAVEHAERALGADPGDPALQDGYAHFRAEAKREHTAQTYVMAAQQLVGHDEQVKALRLLEDCVPVFATDHPAVVQLRSSIRERLSWTHDPAAFADHYEHGGSKPEDFLDDEQARVVCERLPRVGFLIDGLREQAA